MTDLPWVAEAKKHVGLQEVRDKAKLMAYFATANLHYDPVQTPWCGIGLAAIFHNSLPKQPMPPNPAWAQNWLKFGVPCTPQVGAVLVFVRNGGGHVTICLGQYQGDFVCLGCNQDNSINISLKSRKNLLGARWADRYGPVPNATLPTLADAQFKAMTSMA
jgi:uncharacterized protein (TIGR02594 family)